MSQRAVVRNRGFISQREQARLEGATVAIAGAGGDGGQLALTLARMGVRRFALADPEVFEAENLNRQAGCRTTTLGRNKASVIAELVRDINPEAEVEVFSAGVDEANVDAFLDGADLLVDETEYTKHWLAVMLARAARRRGIPTVMGFNVGFGTLVSSFVPGGRTLERHIGLSPTQSLQTVASTPVGLGRWIARLPRYGDVRVLALVETGEMPAPSVAPGVQLAAAAIATEVFNHLTGRRRPVTAPCWLWIDALERDTRVIRNPWLSLRTSVLGAMLRTAMGLNEPMLTEVDT